MSHLLLTTIHRLGIGGDCELCGLNIGTVRRAVAGEYVGVTTFDGQNPTSYRIGSNNRNTRCDGALFTEFSQDSLCEAAPPA